MQHQWQLERSSLARPDGSTRWDQVYQCLLQWTQETHPQEEDHENRSLRTGIDPAPATSSDD
jgi:hypothetical protein